MLLTAVQISKLTNTSKANISKLTRNGKLARNENKKYDSENKINLEYLFSHGLKISDIEEKVLSMSKKKTITAKKSNESPKKKEKKIEKTEQVLEEKIPQIAPKTEISNKEFENITGLPEKMLSLTLMELVAQYGGQMQLEKWASILQKLSTAQKAQVSIERDRVKLIEKDFVISQVFKFVDEFINKIFDSIDAENEIIFSLAKSGSDEAKIKIKQMRKNNCSKLSKEVKKIITNNLEKMKDKYNTGD